MKLMRIFEPITINKTEFKNRMVVSAMVTNYEIQLNIFPSLEGMRSSLMKEKQPDTESMQYLALLSETTLCRELSLLSI